MPQNLTDLPIDITEHAIGKYLTLKDTTALTATSKTTQGLFQPARLQKMANKLLLQVMRGEQDMAENILKIRPDLLMMTGTATDYSGRTFETTAFRYALWALDIRYMCNMMLDCLPCSPQGKAINQELLTQFKSQTQEGLDYELDGMTIHEAHYDFAPIKAAIQTYVNEYDNWYATSNWDAMRHQWSNVVGLAQRYLPANVAQHYCDTDEEFPPAPPFNKKTFKRSLEFKNYISGVWEFWFEPVSSTSGLGVNFGIAGGRGWGCPEGAGEAWTTRETAGSNLAALTSLCEMGNGGLVPLMQRLEGPIQKPGMVQKRY